MAVAIELQPERTPGWHPQMDQSQLCIHEVEVVVQAFAAVRLEKVLAGLLVVPGLVAVAGLHGRDHMHQAGMIPPLGQYLGDHLFLANVALGDVLDRNPSLARNRRRPLTHPIPQRHAELRVDENAYALRIKNVGHASRKARPWKRSRDQNSIVAGQHTRDMLTIAFRQRPRHAGLLPPHALRYNNPVWFRLRRLREGEAGVDSACRPAAAEGEGAQGRRAFPRSVPGSGHTWRRRRHRRDWAPGGAMVS